MEVFCWWLLYHFASLKKATLHLLKQVLKSQLVIYQQEIAIWVLRAGWGLRKALSWTPCTDGCAFTGPYCCWRRWTRGNAQSQDQGWSRELQQLECHSPRGDVEGEGGELQWETSSVHLSLCLSVCFSASLSSSCLAQCGAHLTQMPLAWVVALSCLESLGLFIFGRLKLTARLDFPACGVVNSGGRWWGLSPLVGVTPGQGGQASVWAGLSTHQHWAAGQSSGPGRCTLLPAASQTVQAPFISPAGFPATDIPKTWQSNDSPSAGRASARQSGQGRFSTRDIAAPGTFQHQGHFSTRDVPFSSRDIPQQDGAGGLGKCCSANAKWAPNAAATRGPCPRLGAL